jgi:hypothetical protein
MSNKNGFRTFLTDRLWCDPLVFVFLCDPAVIVCRAHLSLLCSPILFTWLSLCPLQPCPSVTRDRGGAICCFAIPPPAAPAL